MKTVKGFMCIIDFEEEFGHNRGGNRVFPSIEALKDEHGCWEECGIIEVEVRSIKIVEPQKLPNF